MLEFLELKGTGTEVFTNLKTVQEPEPTFRTEGNRNSNFWPISQKNYSEFAKKCTFWIKFNLLHEKISSKNVKNVHF